MDVAVHWLLCVSISVCSGSGHGACTGLGPWKQDSPQGQESEALLPRGPSVEPTGGTLSFLIASPLIPVSGPAGGPTALQPCSAQPQSTDWCPCEAVLGHQGLAGCCLHCTCSHANLGNAWQVSGGLEAGLYQIQNLSHCLWPPANSWSMPGCPGCITTPQGLVICQVSLQMPPESGSPQFG